MHSIVIGSLVVGNNDRAVFTTSGGFSVDAVVAVDEGLFSFTTRHGAVPPSTCESTLIVTLVSGVLRERHRLASVRRCGAASLRC